MYLGLHVKYPLFLSDFTETWIFLTDFRKDAQISDFMKIRPVGVQFYVDRRLDRHDEANGRFPQFCHRAIKSRENPTAVVR